MGMVSRSEILAELDQFIVEKSSLLLPVEKCWQPSDYLPDLSQNDWYEQASQLREGARNLPDSILVTLVANMITEEALPSYHKWLNSLENGLDANGTDARGLAVWTRGWVAEEKRHGDVLQKYLYLSGRVNFRAIEVTLQNLLRNGFDPQTENDIYHGFVYTSFQERATYISHSGVARVARQYGDHTLATICDHISGDEIRHGKAYEKFMSLIFQADPDGAMLSFATMMKRKIVMPSRTMSDGKCENLFQIFSAVTEQNGSYTAADYAEILSHLIRIWKVNELVLVSDAAKMAQEYLVGLPERYMKLVERSRPKRTLISETPLSWIFDRSINAETA